MCVDKTEGEQRGGTGAVLLNSSDSGGSISTDMLNYLQVDGGGWGASGDGDADGQPLC